MILNVSFSKSNDTHFFNKLIVELVLLEPGDV